MWHNSVESICDFKKIYIYKFYAYKDVTIFNMALNLIFEILIMTEYFHL